MNYLLVTTKTTGLDPTQQGIFNLEYTLLSNDLDIQSSTIPDVMTEGKININTLMYAPSYDSKALKYEGITLEEIQSYQDPTRAIGQLNRLLSMTGKVTLVTYGAFSLPFIEHLIESHYKGLYKNLFYYDTIDVRQIVTLARLDGRLPTLTDSKIPTVVKGLFLDNKELSNHEVALGMFIHYSGIKKGTS